MRWVFRALEARDWLLPLEDGKPLEAWPMVPLVWLGLPPLAAIRAVHVLVGMLGAVLIYRLALRIGDRWTAYVSGVLFAVCPYVVYLQRLALSDMLLCTAGIWVLLCTIALLQSPSWQRTAALAVSLLVAALCKIPVGFVFLQCTPLALLIMPARDRQRLQHASAFPKIVVAHVPAVLLAAAIAAVATLRMLHGHPAGFGLEALVGIGLGYYKGIGVRPGIIEELSAQLSGPVVEVAIVGLAAAAILGQWRQRWLVAVGMLPMLAIGLGAQFWYPRYLLFTLPPLIVAAVEGWRRLIGKSRGLERSVGISLLLICLVLMGRQSALLILKPDAASWSPLDRTQYFESYGYPEAARFIRDSAAPQPFIFSLDGHGAYQLRSYLPVQWWPRVQSIYDGPDGRVLSSQAERFNSLRAHEPTWIVIPVHLVDGSLERTFGRQNVAQIELRKIATFPSGSRTELGIYLVGPKAEAVRVDRPRPAETASAVVQPHPGVSRHPYRALQGGEPVAAGVGDWST